MKIASDRPGLFKEIRIKVIDDREGKMGRSAARNAGIDQVDTEWIFFLDADDLMHPDAFLSLPSGSFSAVFGNIMEYDKGLAHWRYQVPEIKSYQELISYDPYITLQMGHFVRTEVAKKLRFNEEMDTGEDWDYYLRLWKSYDAIKIRDCLMINRRGMHSTGPRSATGRDWMDVVHKMLQEARDEAG